MKQLYYKDILGTIVIDSINSLPIGYIDDVIINPENLKIESFLIKGISKEPKLIKPNSIIGDFNDEEISVSESSLLDISSVPAVKKILESGIGIIWNDVKNLENEKVGTVVDFVFNPISFQGVFLVIKKSFLRLFYFGQTSMIPKEKIIDIKKDFVLIKDKSILIQTI